MIATRNQARRRTRLIVASLLFVLVSPALAQYPDKPIKLIVPYAPGGSSDIVGRIVGEFLEKAIGQPIIIENVGGAGGAAGTQRGAGAPPDGYTLLLGANSELLINKLLQPNLSYEAARDFTPIALVGTGAIVVLGKADISAATWPDVVALAGKSPKGLNYGTSGHGTIQHLGGELLKSKTSINMTHVPYRGAGPLMNDILAGHVDLGVATLASALPFIEAGKARAYAVLSAQRSEFGKQIPSVTEFPGLTDVTLETWYGVFAPANLPAPIAATLEEKLLSVLDNPELKQRLASQAISIRKMAARELKEFITVENEKYRRIIRDANITVQ
jgi:tripartite-type tricarboxylate transporter receptor subunit TctC